MKGSESVLTSDEFWSEAKQDHMRTQLVGFWALDEWEMKQCPLVAGDGDPYPYPWTLRFTCISPALNNELKYAIWLLFLNGTWSVHSRKRTTYLKRLVSWLNCVAPAGNSLIEESLGKRELSLLSYLAEQDLLNEKPQIRRDRFQQVRTYPGQDRCIMFLHVIYSLLHDAYDERSEYEKDSWDLRKVSSSLDRTYSNYFLNFTPLNPPWLKSAAKQYLRFRLPTTAASTCCVNLSALRLFSVFVSTHYPELHPAEIDRSFIEHYLSFLADASLGEKTRRDYLAVLRNFLELCTRESWLEVTDRRLIFDDDFPPLIRPQPRYIPEDVMQQLNRHIEALPPQIMRMTLILQECGMRIGELCTLTMDCLMQDGTGDWFLRFYQRKMKKEHSIPIERKIVAVIQEQQLTVREQWGEQETLLFPREPESPMKREAFVKALNDLARKKEIKDATGNLYHFQTHQFRHTVGTRMINNGVPQHIVQRYLGHESPEMTGLYTFLFDQTMKEEYGKFRGKVVNVRGRVIEPVGEVDSNEAQWLKKNILAQSLPNGRCALPLVAGECPHANACLTCDYFRTDASFLPQHQAQLQETQRVIQVARSNGWKRQVEMNERVETNLIRMISTLEEPAHGA